MTSIARLIAAALAASFVGSTIYLMASPIVGLWDSDASVVSVMMTIVLTPMLIIVLGGAVWIGIGLIWSIPALIVGSSLVFAQRFGSLAKAWLIWLIVTVAAMLVIHPFVDSQFRDPAPPRRETVIAMIAAMIAMQLFRVIALSDRAVVLDRRYRARDVLLALSVLGLLGAAINWRSDYAYRHRFEVRPSQDYSPQPTPDASPTEVTLHEYVKPDFGQGPRYLTTGKSLTLRLPKSYFRDAGQQAGGPQRDIRLYLRAGDFASLGALAHRRSKVGRDHKRVSRYLDAVGTTVQIKSIDDSKRNFAVPYASNIASNEPESVVGKRCGMTFVTPSNRPNPSDETNRAVLRRDLYLANRELLAFVPKAGPHGVIGANCQPRLDKCHVDFLFHGFPGDYWIKKRDFCQWPAETARLFNFLGKHLVRQTSARPGPHKAPPPSQEEVDRFWELLRSPEATSAHPQGGSARSGASRTP